MFAQMRPDLLLADTTPAGGDMGAHVWAPAYLRDHLLTQGRLAGWSPDWYTGLPLYQFYMVVPALAIVAVNAGFTPWIGVPLVGTIAAVLIARAGGFRSVPRWQWIGLAVLAVLLISVPYGISFKLVAVSGVVLMPFSAWLMARWARCPEPVPGFVALAILVFLWDTNFNIYGGNVMSTLAGEFAFSISLALTLLAIGLAFRGMDTNSGRVVAAIVIAGVALTHIIPLFLAMAALALIVVLAPDVPRTSVAGVGGVAAMLPVALGEDNNWLMLAIALAAWLALVAAVVLASPLAQQRFRWLLFVGPTAALMSCFWLIPFVGRHHYFNDMGWERLTEVGDAFLTTPMRVALPLAAVGAVVSFAARDRLGMLFTMLGLLFATLVANLGESALFNARLLPFVYLSGYVMAAIALAHAARYCAAQISGSIERPDQGVMAVSAAVALVLAVVGVSIPLRTLPGMTTAASGGSASFLGITSNAKSPLPAWIAWNFSGYERKSSYHEYRDIVATMKGLGVTEGCGRAMWEYDKELDRYGTPMALMLLPHWTDGCIGSMEGLYFESSATTPFHFLNQSTLSFAPSRAQRDLPYQNFDLDLGIQQIQTMGVRYYMAESDQAIAAARAHPDLVEVADSPPWIVFRLADYSLVEGLDATPVVAAGLDAETVGEEASRFDVGWVSQAVLAHNDPERYQALPAEFGPDDWEEVTVLTGEEATSIEPATVTNVETDRNSISFDVDEVGKPVLVKTSYFPNWGVSGADGPYRAGPNMMVVVPTESSVQLHYGYTPLDLAGYFLTLVGLVGLWWLWRLDRRSGWFKYESMTADKVAQDRSVNPQRSSVANVTDVSLDQIVKAYDIRGVYPDQINAEVCNALGVGFAQFVRVSEPDTTSVIIARDMRPSGPELVDAFAAGVRRQGLDVVDIGLASTDMLYFASGSLDAPGAMFTASHNPAEYNGIKMCASAARPIGQDTGLADIKATANAHLRGEVPAAETEGTGSEQNLLAGFAQHVRSFIDTDGLRPLKVVADTANGMGGYVVPAAFEGLPFDLEVMYPELDGTFPNHPADPIQVENLADLRARVVETGADIGLAFDGDADRVFLVDERGEPVSGSLTTALLASTILARNPGGKIVFNLICSKAVPEVVTEAGGVPIRSRVGHSFIKATMADEGAVFGGEHSAHYYFADNWRADSGLIAAMMVLGVLGAEEKPLSEVLAPLDRYAASGEINTRVDDAAAVIETVAAHYEAQGCATDRLDGLTVDGGEWWFNLRPSNTEPLLRLNLEAPDADAVAAKVAEVQAVMAS